ncbi:F-box family protein [Tripterygium wilfordii]|uniref:F-box family protein n=1 Tax=Tripterygium wilfordii TaxID=458696 RepID=A0A7J7CME5_TRIWF|nr:F-box/kelch-repeat protein SKIP25-like [Tripterygium wilfordii]KAF5735224.1 F-box family protein [Tripterygium wilfordii]
MSNPVQDSSSSSSSSSGGVDTNNDNHNKRQKHNPQESQSQPLIPGLPDHIAQLCLSHVNNPLLLFSVSHSWRRLLYSPSFPPFLSLYAIFYSASETDEFNTHPIKVLAFDPLCSRWSNLPPPPPDPPLHLLLRHPAFISRNLPIQSVSAAGQLILLAATDSTFLPALSRPLCFDPQSISWAFGPPIDTPRRWCVAGVCAGAVYMASGMGSHFSYDVAKSVAKWDLNTKKFSVDGGGSAGSEAKMAVDWKWEKLKGLKNGRFCRDAIDAVGWRGKLCMGTFLAKEGFVYDMEDTWQKMPEGMAAGWRGPAATMDEEVMYVVEEAKGVLSKYDPEKDHWEDVIESERLEGARQISASGGRVCVVCKGGRIVVVDAVAPAPERVWVVDTPPGLEPVSVHILPRISRSAPE